MVADPLFFRDLGFVFVAAVIGAGLAWAARQPMILGYVAGGLLIGPFTPGPTVSDLHTFELFAEIGVVLLMFSIGIEFSLRDLLRVRWVALLGGPLGIVLSVGLTVSVFSIAGWPPFQGAIVGMVISVASTMVLARLLVDRGELRSDHGRIMIGISIVEDLAVVVFTVLLPALGALEPGRLLTIALALGRAALILGPLMYVAAKVVPPIMARVARTHSDELFVMVALAIGLGTAALTQALGLSLALGAFLAGLTISASDYAHEALDRLLPLRDAFVALFFVTVGALVNPTSVMNHLPLLGVMVGLIVVGNLVIWTGVIRLFRYPLATALLAAIGLTQIGEFSFILVQVARMAGHVGDDVYNATLAVSLLTILINAPLMRHAPTWVGSLRLMRDRRGPSPGAGEREGLEGHVVLCGFGRVGSAIGEALETFHVPYLAIEHDTDIIRGLRNRGVPCLFGSAARRSVLMRAGIDRALLVIVALPDIDPARVAVRRIRALHPDVPILARAHGRAEAESLHDVGATEVIQPEVEASATLIRHALSALKLPKDSALAYLERFRAAMETAEHQRVGAVGVLPEVREVRLGERGIVDQSLHDARIRERFGVTVVAISRPDGIVLNPPAETILRPGDTVRVFGLPDQIDAFLAATGDRR
jgi:CPA2 family monovalent cation:H+ antiporter-2